MDGIEVASLTEGLDVDDIVDILQQLPDRVIPGFFRLCQRRIDSA